MEPRTLVTKAAMNGLMERLYSTPVSTSQIALYNYIHSCLLEGQRASRRYGYSELMTPIMASMLQHSLIITHGNPIER